MSDLLKSKDTYLSRDSSSIVDGLENGERIGGISKEVFYQQTFCCKSSYLLNDTVEQIDLNEFRLIIKLE